MKNKYFIGYRCTKCGKFFTPEEASFTCPCCGESGILDVIYDYEAMNNHDSLQN